MTTKLFYLCRLNLFLDLRVRKRYFSQHSEIAKLVLGSYILVRNLRWSKGSTNILAMWLRVVCWKLIIVGYRIFKVGELIGQDIKTNRSREKSERHNHTRSEIDSNSTIGEKETTSKDSFNAARSKNKNTSINAKERREKKRKYVTYECSICHMNFALHGKYKQHMVKHSDERPFKCTVCERTFKRLSELNNHMQIHSDVTYTCEICSFVSINKVSLKTHIRRVHKRNFRYHCEQCGKGFMSNYDLEDHKTSHLGSKTFVCDCCGKAYLQKSYLAAHKRMIHGLLKTTPKQYQCDLCSKSFASMYSLCNHKNLHSQKFLCAQCGKEFATNHALKLHDRMHTGERPYQCELCQKAFARSAALRVHMLIHTGERPYVCNICGHTFTQRSSMMGHRRKHPNVNNYPPPPPLLLSTQKSN